MTHLQARQILGLTADFTAQELKKAYRKKAAVTHPDTGGDSEQFHLVNLAYEFLADPENGSKNSMLITHISLFKITKKG